MNTRTFELLAPAKDAECGIAAINCGADAVYIGARKFGARESAGNSLEDIATLLAYAHKYWAKVYVTINTLLHNDEIPLALELISKLYELGVDGLIIQDAGLLECDLPPIPLIASTQMHNNMPEKVAFLEQVGFQRAILARELDLSQIKAIRKQTSMELEVFVHGSICVCYSGQCYLSYGIGGRSGNRGSCAQPCRKLYSLQDAAGKTLVKDKHLLSIRDLNLSENLGELVDAGVTSFKVEGRLKDKAYVSNVVAYYRAKLDEVLEARGLQRSSSGTSHIDFTPDLAKTFNRGYTTHFLHGRDQKIGAMNTPKMVGEEIGTVITISTYGMVIDSDISMHPGDGICFYDHKGELRGTVVNGVNGRVIVPDKFKGIDEGTLIFRNHDHEFLNKLEKSKPQRQVEVWMKLKETPDGLALSVVDEDDNSAEFSITCEKEVAQKPDVALDNIRKQLAKTGGSDFECSDVEIDLPVIPFLPISTLNTLRRGVLEELAAVRESNRPRLTGGPVKNDFPYPATTLGFEGNVLNIKAEDFYTRHGVTEIDEAAESGLDMHGRKVMTLRYCLKHQFGKCPKQQKTLVPTTNDRLYLVDEEGNKLELRFDCPKCEMEVHLM